MRPKQAGFTLVEIAVVLVIVGLLLGGVLKGQEMIAQARIKNLINDFNGITAAYQSYNDRYRARPGDDTQAAARWTAAAPANGNGNGLIAGLYNATITAAPATAEESNLFWQHLRLAGFIAGATTGAESGQQPQNASGGVLGVEQGVPGTNGMGFSGLIVCASNLPDKIAIAIDSQMDDGNATTGNIRGQLQSSSNPNTGTAAPTTNYAETGQNQYLLCKLL